MGADAEGLSATSAETPPRRRTTTTSRRTTRGACDRARSTPTRRPSRRGRTPLTWTRTRRRCCPRPARGWPTPSAPPSWKVFESVWQLLGILTNRYAPSMEACTYIVTSSLAAVLMSLFGLRAIALADVQRTLRDQWALPKAASMCPAGSNTFAACSQRQEGQEEGEGEAAGGGPPPGGAPEEAGAARGRHRGAIVLLPRNDSIAVAYPCLGGCGLLR